MVEESASDRGLPPLSLDDRGLLTSLRSYGFAPKDSGTWDFSVAPASEEKQRRRQGDLAGSSRHPELCLQVTRHDEAFGHTWYHVRCSLGCPWSGTRLQWQAKWRLVHLRKFLHGPVKSVLGPAYGRFFARAPFARKGGLPGTTFRLDAWCKALARCINLRACPPGLVWLTLSFLQVPDPPNLSWARGAAAGAKQQCSEEVSKPANCEASAPEPNLELLETWVPPEDGAAEVALPEPPGSPRPKDSGAEVPLIPDRKLCSGDGSSECQSVDTGDHLALPVSERDPLSSGKESRAKESRARDHWDHSGDHLKEEVPQRALAEARATDGYDAATLQAELSAIRVSSERAEGSMGPRAPPTKWARDSPSKLVSDDALEESDSPDEQEADSQLVATSPKAVACQTGLGGLFWSSVAQSSVACAQPVPEASLIEASSPKLPRLVLSAHQHQPCSAYEGEPVWLHIYDVKESVQWVNNLILPAGAGAFHAAVEVFGLEWSFGYSPEEKTGVYSCHPRSNKQHKYRESVAMGGTPLAPELVSEILGQLAREWPGRSYDLLVRNCCHFSDALCRRLGVGPAPAWMTALASAGASLVDSVDQMVAGAKAVGGIAAAIDERYQISTTFEGFVPRELQIDEDLVEATVLNLWNRAAGLVK